MSCIKDTRELLQEFNGIDQIFLYNIPEKYIDDTTQTQCLLREIQIDTDKEGNNDFNAVINELELQVFLKKDLEDFDMQSFQTKLLKLLTQNHYTVNSLGGSLYDPDTQQLTMTWYIEKEIYL